MHAANVPTSKAELPKTLCFHMGANRDRRAANSNVPRMYPNVPECTSNVPPNVPNGFGLLKNIVFSYGRQPRPALLGAG